MDVSVDSRLRTPVLTRPFRLSANQIQKLLNQYLVADYEQPINGDIMKAVASRVTDKSNEVLLLQAVDTEDSGPYEIPEPRQIGALETYCPSYLQTPKLRRLAEIVAAQAKARAEAEELADEMTEEEGMLEEGEAEAEALETTMTPDDRTLVQESVKA